MSTPKIHQIRIDFQVTEQIRRYVFVYIIEGQYCYLVDTGVFGCENHICDYLKSIGRDVSHIKGILLTHAHPDHIGSAAWFKNNTGCTVYASKGERAWIENIDLQFKERPIPNFFNLAGQSTKIDTVLSDGDTITLENDLSITVIGTPGHSSDSISYIINDSMFIGDAVPVAGDIPICVNIDKMYKTLSILANKSEINHFYPAWDTTYSAAQLQEKIKSAKSMLQTLESAVHSLDNGLGLGNLVNLVCERLNMPMLKSNPLFATTVQCMRKKGNSP